jgi:hypothetical protein
MQQIEHLCTATGFAPRQERFFFIAGMYDYADQRSRRPGLHESMHALALHPIAVQLFLWAHAAFVASGREGQKPSVAETRKLMEASGIFH